MIGRSRAEHVVPRHTWSEPHDPVLTLAARGGGGCSFFRGQRRLGLYSLTTIVERVHYTRGCMNGIQIIDTGRGWGVLETAASGFIRFIEDSAEDIPY